MSIDEMNLCPAADIASDGRTEVKLKRQLGLVNGVTLIVGVIIGSGIFISPKGVIEQSDGSVGVAIMFWILCGLVSLLGALCYAELGCTITESGGDYAYIKETFGPFAAFLQLWVNLIVLRPTAQSIMALTFANYAIQPFFPTCAMPQLPVQFLAACCILCLTWVNVMRVKWATTIQDLFTFAKLAALIIIIITGIILLGKGQTGNFEYVFEINGNMKASNIAFGFYSGLFAYAGWNYLNFVTEELENPFVNLPRSIYISITLVTATYVLTNVAYFVVLTPNEIMNSEAVAVLFAERVFGKFALVMPIFVSLSCFGGVNGLLFTSGRLNFVAARDGLLPPVLATIHSENLTPVPSILVTSALSLAMLFIPNVGALINYVSFVQWLSVGMSVIGMIYLRYKDPDRYRPIKFHISLPIIFAGVCAFLVLMPLFSEPRQMFTGLAIVLSGIPVYVVCVMWNNKPSCFLRWYYSVMSWLQITSSVVKAD